MIPVSLLLFCSNFCEIHHRFPWIAPSTFAFYLMEQMQPTQPPWSRLSDWFIFILLFLTRSSCSLCVAGCFVSIKQQRRRCTWSREVHTLAWPLGVPAELTSPPRTPLLLFNPPPLPEQPLPFYVELSPKQASPHDCAHQQCCNITSFTEIL